MAEEKAQLNFTVVPDEDDDRPPGLQQLLRDPELPVRLHADVLRDAAARREARCGRPRRPTSVKAPVRARLVVPVQMIPGLIAALQDNFRLYQESFGPPKGPVN